MKGDEKYKLDQASQDAQPNNRSSQRVNSECALKKSIDQLGCVDINQTEESQFCQRVYVHSVITAGMLDILSLTNYPHTRLMRVSK